MRVRKIAKQLKRYHTSFVGVKNNTGVYTYKMRDYARKVDYILRMTRKNYYGIIGNRKTDLMLRKLAIHNACSPYLYDDVLEFWKIKENNERLNADLCITI